MDKKNLIIKLFKSLRGEKEPSTFKPSNLHSFIASMVYYNGNRFLYIDNILYKKKNIKNLLYKEINIKKIKNLNE
jgi:hypothetical protein